MTLPVSQDILFATASQTISIDVLEGRPTWVSTTVYEDASGDTGSTESAITGTPAVETNPNTTVDVACGPSSNQTNMRKVPVAVTTGFTVGRQYLLTDATFGHYEVIECAGISSGDHILIRNPLINTYATSSTVQSTRMTATIDTTWASDSSNLSDLLILNPRYRAAWVYTVGGVTYRQVTYFNLVRIDGALHGVTPIDVEKESPGWIDRLLADHRVNQGRSLIEHAAEIVKDKLYSIDRIDWAQRSSRSFQRLICLQAVVLGHRASFEHGGTNEPQLNRAVAEFQTLWDSHMNAARAPEQTDTTGAGAQPNRSEIWRR